MKPGHDSIELFLQRNFRRLAMLWSVTLSYGLSIVAGVIVFDDVTLGPTLTFIVATWVVVALIPLVLAWTYRLTLDGGGITERIGPFQRYWPWTLFKSGDAIPIRGRMAFRFPNQSWWKRRLSFEIAGEENSLSAFYAALDRCAPTQLPPAPAELRLKSFAVPPVTLRLTRDGCEVRRLNTRTRLSWAEAETIAIIRRAQRVRGWNRIEFRFHNQRFVILLGENGRIYNWRGATDEELESFVVNHLRGQSLNVSLFEPPQCMRELKYRKQLHREQSIEGFFCAALVFIMVIVVGIVGIALLHGLVADFGLLDESEIAILFGTAGLFAAFLAYGLALPVVVVRSLKRQAEEYAKWKRGLSGK